ncbi:phosphatidylinositol phosphatase PTPRQ isoform X3 [Hydra vulgaris]|uniref:Phosphatidylinositol phosphatase PTPRQ isoform X3 n=1 Tax=Hydra vulgaris TaxID=6087 RepID=A0ABM4CYL3_HYDVU
MKQVWKLLVFGCWCCHIKGEIQYLIEPYDLPNCYFDLDLNTTEKFITYNCSGGLKFLLVNGVYGDGVSFQSVVDKTKYLRHYSFILRLHTLNEVISILGDQQFYIHQSYYDSYVLLRSTNFPFLYLRHNNLLFNIDFYNDQLQSICSFKLLVYDLNIIQIYQLTRYSVIVTIDVNAPIFNTSNHFVIKCKDPNNETKLFNVSGSSALITSLHSYTIYEFSAGLLNEFGFYVYGNLFYFQTNKDDLNIISVESIDRYSANVTINPFIPIWNISTIFVVKYTDPNNVSMLYSFTNGSAVISLLQSYTVYQLLAGVKNEFGVYVFGNVFFYQTDKDDLNIISVESINRYSVNVIINPFIPIWNISAIFVVKYTDPNNFSMLYNSTNGSAVISSLQSYTVYQLSAGVKNEFGVYVFGNVVFYQTDQDILNIISVKSIDRYSVNVTINPFIPIWNISTIFVVKYTDPNNVSMLYNVTNGSAVISSLQSYTVYQLSAGVKNEFGVYVFGSVVFYQTDQDIPTGCPSNLTVVTISSTALLLSWDKVEYSLRKGIIITYLYTCYSTDNSISNNVGNNTFNVAVNDLVPDTDYNCSVAACTKVGCGAPAIKLIKTLGGIPTGCPSNLTAATISSTALLLSWDKVEYSLRKGVVIMYLYTCYSTENSISNNVSYNTFNVTVNDLVPDTYYNCSVAACTIMGCGPPAIEIIKTLVGNIHMGSCIYGLVEKDILNISLQLNGNGFNVTIEYFFPLFVTFTSESIQHGFIKPNSAQFKYIFSGYFNTNGANIHNITLKVNKRNCFRDFLIEIPVKLSYQNKLGILKVVTMAYQKSFTCLYKVLPKIPRDKNALSEYYGRGIYIDNEKFDFYFCVNQHVESTVPACYYSEIHDGYGLWTDLDVRVGCVLGHHLVTKELWAIHRNQQSYLYFHGFYGKWLAVSKGDNIAANNFNKSMRMSLEDDEDQVYTFGSNQWMGNAEGLFYRNGSLSSWLQKVRWTL